ncbi:RNA polymerase sigma factor [Streptomyces sp. NPDC056716]|uniref:RNA polymerase sigma factor n=1 Tax=unclassified Streptomyces TaxID=2593676 RepID=UPI0036AC29C0
MSTVTEHLTAPWIAPADTGGPGAPTPPADTFDTVFGPLLPRLYRRSRQLTRETSYSAEDAVHDAYVKLAARPASFLSHPDPYAYAFRALLSVIRDRWRRERRMVPTAEVDAHVTTAWDGGVARRAAELDVLRLLTTLTPQQARSVILVDLDGHTLDQAADIMGVHRATVAGTRARALHSLRHRLAAPCPGRRDH